MDKLAGILADLDDLKSALYELAAAGGVDDLTNDQVQELLREAYALLDE